MQNVRRSVVKWSISQKTLFTCLLHLLSPKIWKHPCIMEHQLPRVVRDWPSATGPVLWFWVFQNALHALPALPRTAVRLPKRPALQHSLEAIAPVSRWAPWTARLRTKTEELHQGRQAVPAVKCTNSHMVQSRPRG